MVVGCANFEQLLRSEAMGLWSWNNLLDVHLYAHEECRFVLRYVFSFYDRDQLLAVFESKDGRIPIVIVTAMQKESDKRQGIDVGAQAYIVKTTFDQSNLLDTIERLIG